MENSQDQGLPAISVVLPARNASATLGLQLSALQTQATTVPFEVIVVDSASEDDTHRVAGTFPGVRVVRVDIAGLNRARNAGVTAARGDVILLCDADDVVNARWIEAMSDAAKLADYFGGPLEMYNLNSSTVLSRWGIDEPMRFLTSPGPFPSPIGANCGFKRSVWCAIGGFDARLSGAGDEYEFFWRAGEAGYLFGAAQDAVVSYRLRVGRWAILRREFNAGRADVITYTLAKRIGLKRDSSSQIARIYMWLLLETVRSITNLRRRWTWARVGARRMGRIVESLNSRCWFP